MAKSGFVVKGDKALAKTLAALPGKLFIQVIKKANTEVMKPVSKMAKSLARGLAGSGEGKIPPKVAAALAKAIGRRTKVYKSAGNVVTVVGPRFGASVQSGGGTRGINYLEIEFGKPEQDLNPQAYMRRAWDSTNAKVERDYAKAVKIGLTKIAARSKKK